MNSQLTEMLTAIALFASIVLIIYFTMRYNYQTKKILVEQGVDIQTSRKTFPFLEIGFTILGVGLGIGLSVIPQTSNLPINAAELLTGSLILFCGGLGLVSAYFIRRRLEKQD